MPTASQNLSTCNTSGAHGVCALDEIQMVNFLWAHHVVEMVAVFAYKTSKPSAGSSRSVCRVAACFGAYASQTETRRSGSVTAWAAVGKTTRDFRVCVRDLTRVPEQCRRKEAAVTFKYAIPTSAVISCVRVAAALRHFARYYYRFVAVSESTSRCVPSLQHERSHGG